MTLASMINLDEDALICDLAETYQIFDYRSLPVKLVATLSAGLRDDSRIKMAAAGAPASQNTIMLAIIADLLDRIRYMFADEDSRGSYTPISMLAALYGEKPTYKSKSGVMSFDTSEEFEAALARIRGE